MIDLHTHSSASDGLFSPSELVAYAQGKGLSVLALTDHDTVAGLAGAEAQAVEAGITFVPGIELNIERARGEFHLLGYGVPSAPVSSQGIDSAPLESIIANLQNGRIERNQTILEKMKNDGFPVSYEELLEKNSGTAVGCIGRPHIAAYLVEKKLCRTRQQAFDKFLGTGRPYYTDRTAAPLSDAVAAIKAAGGIPVIAHPLSLYISWSKMEGAMREVAEAGVQGLEAWHPGVRVGEAERLEALARTLGLFVTAGSDFHGEKIRADRRIGHTAGLLKIEERFWTDELKPALDAR